MTPFQAGARPLALAAVLVAAALSPDAKSAEPPSELDALTLADEAAPQQPARRDAGLRLFGELAVGRSSLQGGGGDDTTRRASLDLRVDHGLAPGWRAVLSNRLDLADRSGARASDINTLREAYLRWSWSDTRTVELGRLNVVHGAAMGYNPTDYFKSHALRSVVTPDPAALRENRQGTVVLQGQQLWSTGSLTALYSPDLGRRPSDAAYSLNAGATNPDERWLIVLGQRLGETLNPQLLLHGGQGLPVQAGLNLSLPLGQATVAFAEVSAGDGRSLRAEALGLAEPRTGKRRAAAGFTYTTPFNLSLTAELEHNGAGLDHAAWTALGAGERLAVLAEADAQQDLPSRRTWFLHAAWSDVLFPGLDLAAYLRRESATGSRDFWMELRYRWTSTEVALQWQQFDGDAGSIYRAVPQRRAVEAVLRHYF